MRPTGRDSLIATLRTRFDKYIERHEGLEWASVEAALEASPATLKALSQMEASGGEPDVIGREGKAGRFIFCDCAAESRRNAAASATTARRSRRGRRTSQPAARCRWQTRWVFSC